MNGRYAFQEPTNEHFLAYNNVDPLWAKFKPMELVHNHRQGKESEWTNTLNRIRDNTYTEEDVEVLKSRISADPHNEQTTKHVTYTNEERNAHNKKMLDTIDSPEVVLRAIHRPNKNIQIDPVKGTIGKTNFVDVLKIKIGCRVTMVYNVRTLDGLVNGAEGTVVGLEKNKQQEIYAVIVQFDDKKTGLQHRQDNKHLSDKYKAVNGTPVYRQTMEYQKKSRLSKSGNVKAYLTQFPLDIAYGSTSHKMQVRNFELIPFLLLVCFNIMFHCSRDPPGRKEKSLSFTGATYSKKAWPT